MNVSIKQLFQHYLSQLDVIVSKIPPDIFSEALSEGMFSLGMNAKIASNFVLRGYCPLLKIDTVSFDSGDVDKVAIQKQIVDTLSYINNLPEVEYLDSQVLIKERAGFADIELAQPLFIHQYIFPNFFFHISMVYAIAKANGVDLSKADFDGLHSYPLGFSFVAET